MDYNKTASAIIELVGGSENVVSLTHCVTRLRFKLKDESIAMANLEKVSQVEGVMKVLNQGGQFQVVIGAKVEKVFDEAIALLGNIQGNDVSTKEETTEEKKNEKVTDKIMHLVSGIMLPVMPAFAGAGMLKCLLIILNLAGILSTDSGTYQVFYGISDAVMYFLPVILGGSTAKYFKMDVYVGNLIGAALIYPTFVTAAGKGESFSFLKILHIAPQNYTSTVFPVIVSVWFASLIYKQLKKIIPDAVKFFLLPMIVIMVTVPIALLIIGPAMSFVSGILAKAVVAIIKFCPPLAGFLIGGAWLVAIVPLGLHWGFIPIFMSNYATLGYEPISGLLVTGLFAATGTLLAAGIKAKTKNVKSLAFSSALSNTLGISEPGLYGIIMLHKQTIVTTFLAGGIGSAIAGFSGTAAHSIAGAAGLFALPAYIPATGIDKSFIGLIIGIVVSFILGFVLTMIAKFDPDQV